MDWSGATLNPVLNGLNSMLSVNGSIRFINAMTVSVKRIDFLSQNPGNTINSDGVALDTLYIKGAGAFSLVNELNCKSLFIENGSFNTSNFNIITQKLRIYYKRNC